MKYNVTVYNPESNAFTSDTVVNFTELGFSSGEALHIKNQTDCFGIFEFEREGRQWEISRPLNQTNKETNHGI